MMKKNIIILLGYFSYGLSQVNAIELVPILGAVKKPSIKKSSHSSDLKEKPKDNNLDSLQIGAPIIITGIDNEDGFSDVTVGAESVAEPGNAHQDSADLMEETVSIIPPSTEPPSPGEGNMKDEDRSGPQNAAGSFPSTSNGNGVIQPSTPNSKTTFSNAKKKMEDEILQVLAAERAMEKHLLTLQSNGFSREEQIDYITTIAKNLGRPFPEHLFKKEISDDLLNDSSIEDDEIGIGGRRVDHDTDMDASYNEATDNGKLDKMELMKKLALTGWTTIRKGVYVADPPFPISTEEMTDEKHITEEINALDQDEERLKLEKNLVQHWMKELDQNGATAWTQQEFDNLIEMGHQLGLWSHNAGRKRLEYQLDWSPIDKERESLHYQETEKELISQWRRKLERAVHPGTYNRIGWIYDDMFLLLKEGQRRGIWGEPDALERVSKLVDWSYFIRRRERGRYGSFRLMKRHALINEWKHRQKEGWTENDWYDWISRWSEGGFQVPQDMIRISRARIQRNPNPLYKWDELVGPC